MNRLTSAERHAVSLNLRRYLALLPNDTSAYDQLLDRSVQFERDHGLTDTETQARLDAIWGEILDRRDGRLRPDPALDPDPGAAYRFELYQSAGLDRIFAVMVNNQTGEIRGISERIPYAFAVDMDLTDCDYWTPDIESRRDGIAKQIAMSRLIRTQYAD